MKTAKSNDMARRSVSSVDRNTIVSRYKGGSSEFYARWKIAVDRMSRRKKVGRIMDPNFTPKRMGRVSG